MDQEPSDHLWNGTLGQTAVGPDGLPVRDALADAAKQGDWTEVLHQLDKMPSRPGPNRWRPGGSSWYTPLHQAAWHNAPIPVAQVLIERGAWRTLRTAKGQTAQDIASAKGHRELARHLEPKILRPVEASVLAKLDRHLQSLVDSRIRPHLEVKLRYPTTAVLTEMQEGLWFAVPGMYGGFQIELMHSYLYVTSWSRVVGGSGQAHVVTAEGYTKVEEGFV